MKLIIEIPDEVYNFTTQRGHLPYGVNIAGSIIDGKVVSKGHGELVDKDVILDMMNHGILEDYITTMNGVIPADR